MAPTFRHGSGGIRVLVASLDLSNLFANHEVEASVATHDVTTYRTSTGGVSKDRRYVPGLRTSSVKLEGFTDASTDATDFDISLGSTSKIAWTLGPEADTLGQVAVLITADTVKYDRSAPADGVIESKLELTPSQRRQGVWLHALAAETSTGADTGVTIPRSTAGAVATSTRGGVAHLHVTAISTASTTSATIKVQHSSDGASWADLITFTASTAIGVQRSTVAGSVKERVRGIRSALTGSGSKSITYALAFARHPVGVI